MLGRTMKKLIVTVNGVSYEVEVEIIEDEISSMEHTVPNVVLQPTQTTIKPTYTPSPKPSITPFSSAGDNYLRAPMNGKVLDVKAKQGEQVKQGQVLVELEAMKMKTNIYAPRDAVVKAILVATGNLVESGQKLIEFE